MIDKRDEKGYDDEEREIKKNTRDEKGGERERDWWLAHVKMKYLRVSSRS